MNRLAVWSFGRKSETFINIYVMKYPRETMKTAQHQQFNLPYNLLKNEKKYFYATLKKLSNERKC